MAELDPAQLKSLIPFNAMNDSDIARILEDATMVNFGEGKMVFKRDEEAESVYWLMKGSVDLLDDKFNVEQRTAGDSAALSPLDDNTPHRMTMVTTSPSSLLRVGRTAMNGLGQSEDYAVSDLADDDEVDWMSELLKSPLFEFIPPANIQTLFSRFEEVQYQKFQPVITQGAPGDYFYVIQKGRAKVERTAGDKTAVLAELKAGDNFGQDALVSDVPRNATVTMTTSGTLMRLSGPDFESLLMDPVIETLTIDEVREMIAAGDPRTYILDVRSPKELESGKIEGSLNVPLALLRKNLSKLKQNAIYVAACDGGKRSALAAYILNEKGFTAYVLKDPATAVG